MMFRKVNGRGAAQILQEGTCAQKNDGDEPRRYIGVGILSLSEIVRVAGALIFTLDYLRQL